MRVYSSPPLGPGATPLQNHLDDICVLNGIVMREPAAHDLQKLNISSGKGDHSCPNYCAEISFLRNNALPILVKGPITLGNRDVELISLGSFKRDLQSSVATKSLGLDQILQLFFKDITC